jgi:hypothetical protein
MLKQPVAVAQMLLLVRTMVILNLIRGINHFWSLDTTIKFHIILTVGFPPKTVNNVLQNAGEEDFSKRNKNTNLISGIIQVCPDIL